jgi:hypothetical protein
MAVQRKPNTRKTHVKSKPRRGQGTASRRSPSKRKATKGGKPNRAAASRAAKPSRGAAKGNAAARKERDRREALKERERAAKERDRQKAAQEKERLKAKQEKERASTAAKKQRDQEKAAADKERERQHALKEREATKAKQEKERERQKALKAREAEKAQKEKERQQLQALKEKERVKAEKEREKAQAEKAKERERAEKERKREAEKKAKEREVAKKAAEKEKARLEKERAIQREAEKKAREEERVRQKAEKEAEKARLKAEREAERDRLREEARRIKEEERAKREAEREAYRKAKEAEQARLRAEREAARRALEGRVVRATRASRAAASGRAVGTTRVYTPSSIPDQSRTRRAPDGTEEPNPFANLRMPKAQPRTEGEPTRPIVRTLPPPPPPPPPAQIEDRYARILERLQKTDDAFRHEYDESLLMSWIYHDSALEGVVYTYDELRMAINPNITVVPDSSMQTVCDEIRRHKTAIEFVKDQADKKRVPITIDTVKRIYLILHPEEGDLKTVKYRKDIPQHRLYFHEYAAPDKIAYKVRQVFDWLNGPEPKKIKNTVRIAARAHYDLLRVFPFANDSGKAARLFMNLLLMRADCPPAIIHSTERQRYYEALRGQLPVIVTMVTEAITNALSSIEKKLDERDSKLHAFG